MNPYKHICTQEVLNVVGVEVLKQFVASMRQVNKR